MRTQFLCESLKRIIIFLSLYLNHSSKYFIYICVEMFETLYFQSVCNGITFHARPLEDSQAIKIKLFRGCQGDVYTTAIYFFVLQSKEAKFAKRLFDTFPVM